MATKNLLQFVIHGATGYLKVNGGIYWVVKNEANKYSSRYAAKRHLNLMTIHDEVTIEEYRKPNKHILYKTDDKDAPDIIKDRNGEIVLELCRVCGKGEAELEKSCNDL